MQFIISVLILLIVEKLYDTEYGVIGFVLLFSYIILCSFWFPLQGDGIGIYKYWKHDKNPLFAKGYFRKGRKIFFLSELKGLYWTQMVAVLEIAVLVVYGITSLFIGRNWYIEITFLFFYAIVSFVHVSIASHYANIIKKSSKKRKNSKKKKSKDS